MASGGDPRGGPLGSGRCLDSASETRGVGRAAGVVLLGLAAAALVALALFTITSVVGLGSPPAQAPSARSSAPPSRRSSDTAGPGKDKASPPRQTPRTPARSEWPSGAQSSEIVLIATNILPGAPLKSTAVLLDVKSERYVLLSPGDQLGDFEVVSIALDWVQLRRAGSLSWVGYRKSEQRRTKARRSEHRSPPPRVRRRSRAPSVTYKWLVGRLNLYGELEEHLSPKVTAKGLQVGRVTKGFGRIGLQVGDVVQQAGDRKVRSADDIREGLQRAARHGGSGSLTVLRKGRSVKLSFDVR